LFVYVIIFLFQIELFAVISVQQSMESSGLSYCSTMNYSCLSQRNVSYDKQWYKYDHFGYKMIEENVLKRELEDGLLFAYSLSYGF